MVKFRSDCSYQLWVDYNFDIQGTESSWIRNSDCIFAINANPLIPNIQPSGRPKGGIWPSFPSWDKAMLHVD